MTSYARLLQILKQVHLLRSTRSLLDWDQQTMMPPGGLEHRSNQLAQLARMAHEMFTDAAVGDLLDACGDGADDDERVVLRETRRSFDRATRMPASLVAELAAARSVGHARWAEARKASDFSTFRPTLENMVALKRRQAECLGWPDGGEPWDALADDYEPGCTAQQTEALFEPLRRELVKLIEDLRGGAEPTDALLRLDLPAEQNRSFVRKISERLGFEFGRGRLDESAHPFCSGTHCHDVRMTTRFDEPNPIEPLFSTMHETGHGLYEQGLPPEHLGTPLGGSISLGIHESQSRMWENFVGRSRAFWAWCLPQFQEHFGSAAVRLPLDDAYAGANLVRPGFIRVEADEASYNLHIMVRFEIERALINGDLEVADVPAAWNGRYRDYLGLEVRDDARGCLQDVHWSSGGFGYFPTYTFGNLYAAQLFEQARSDLPDLDAQIEEGSFEGLLAWLREHVHRHGMRYRAAELCERVTGRTLSAEPLMRHLREKLRPLYGLS
ncbi:MAG: carboxypeptidase M32 [Phycisphaeraceae bacterium]|nr:carboxypeptidase M32 [Phycisphaeraceae bacterium]